MIGRWSVPFAAIIMALVVVVIHLCGYFCSTILACASFIYFF